MFAWIRRAWVLGGLVALVPANSAWAEIDLLNWSSRGVLVEEGSGSLVETFFSEHRPTSPLHETVSRQIGASALGATYNFVFDDSDGELGFETAHSLKHTRDQCYSMAYGGVGITSTSDFEVTLIHP